MTASLCRFTGAQFWRPALVLDVSLYKHTTMSFKRGNQIGTGSESYTPPEWASRLCNSPRYKTNLAMLNTPIQRWDLPGVSKDFEIYIKRDDMTGSTLSGNKVRKLEFIFADAIEKGCKHLITCGSLQSNYCRAATVAATQLGLKTHLVLRAGAESADQAGYLGNVFLNRLCGAKLYLTPKSASYQGELLPRMEQIAEHIMETTGEKSYLSEVGGSDGVGFYGYLEAYRELLAQGVPDFIDDIVNTTGSGGTSEGLAAGNYLTGSNVKVHSVAVCDDASTFYAHAARTFQNVGLTGVVPEDVFDVIEGYKGRGYGVTSQEDYAFIQEVAVKTGIILDPTYTGKAARGLVQELNANPSRFKGKRILFVHTGGVFGAYDGRIEAAMQQSDQSDKNIYLWNDLQKQPF